MIGTVPPWLLQAAELPLGFAQVREDSALDEAIVRAAGDDGRVCVAMVASGGCTAAALAAAGRTGWLHLVDANPAQIALTRVKLRLLETAAPDERLALLGHASMEPSARQQQLRLLCDQLGLAADSLGPTDLVAGLGPDHSGRYERLFARLRAELSGHRHELEALLRLRDPADQALRADSRTELGRAIDASFDFVMAPAVLVALFGEEATRNPREPFATHFRARLRWALAHQPAAGNPFLAQLLLGRFEPGAEHAWLRAAAPPRMPCVTWAVSPMADALATTPGAFDVVHLSNILDWLSPGAARATLDLAWSALRPGGWVIVRQLNSTLDVAALGERLEWRQELGQALLERDRSFLYRAIHVGRRR